MAAYVVFKIEENYFALCVDNVIRVLNVPKVTPLPKSNHFVDGIINYEEESLEVFNFRRAAGMSSLREKYLKTIEKLFAKPKENRKEIEILLERFINRTGRFEKLNETLKSLKDNFLKEDHSTAEKLLFLNENLGYISNVGQRLLVYSNDKEKFAVKVDEIDSIKEIGDEYISTVQNNGNENDGHLNIKGIYEENPRLIYILDSLSLDLSIKERVNG